MNNKSVWLKMISIVCVTSAVASGFAQRGPGGPGGEEGRGPGQGQHQRRPGPPAEMLVISMGSVQRELKLSASQIEAIKNLRPGGERGGKREGGPLGDILNEAQHRRLRQLVLQFEGIHIWVTPHVRKELNLTREQGEAVRQILEDLRPPKPQEGQRPEFRIEEHLKRRDEGLKRGLPLLSAEQRTILSRLAGDVFTKWEQPTLPKRADRAP
jgi:hypothetical protein